MTTDPSTGQPPGPTAPDGSPLCSAKGCAAPAEWELRWNNPKLHTPERRKVWLACEGHRASLGEFLSARSFLRETVPLGEEPHPSQ
jgi:hypothetical protein